ncbi:MAG TPA: CAP domain-containing protein [Gemmataceae bacterium]|nr:CAP domain-containing protein [Gemmataceae bacterium]
MAFAWFRPQAGRTGGAARTGTHAVRLHVEGMEERACPAVTSNLSNHILTVQGSGADDVITVGVSGGCITAAGKSFATSQVNWIVVVAEGGNDRVTIAETVTKPTRIFGGTGSDVVYGGAGADEIYGGAGADQLYGRGGADVLYGGAGADRLDGGPGRNSLRDGSASRTDSASSTIEQEILRLTNLERTRAGLWALRLNAQLGYMANVQAADMAARSAAVGNAAAMSHTLYGTVTPTLASRADYAGYGSSALAENIAYGTWTAAGVVQAWMNSAGHRANILNPNLREIGIGAAANGSGVRFFCQALGTPG